MTEKRANIIINELKRFKWDMLADLGSHGGIMHDMICSEFRDREITGIDIKGGNSVDIVHDLNEGIPLRDNSIDVITASELIEHLHKPLFFLKECRRVLKDNGTLILTTPNARGLNVMQKRGSKKHIYLWTLPQFDRLIRVAGFNPVRWKYSSAWKRNLIFRVIATLFPYFSTTIMVVAKRRREK